MQTIETLLIGLIPSLTSIIAAYVILKKTINTERILTISEDLLDEITQNAELQKKIYVLGVLLGNGIRSGVGIGTKGGKFKFEDLIGQALAGILGKALGGEQQETGAVNPFGQTT